MSPLAEWLREQCEALRARRVRGVLWIAADPDTALARASEWIAAGDWRTPLWLGPVNENAPGIPRLAAAKARSRLGQEHDLVVIDAVSPQGGFDPDAFGALSGTVLAGGWLVLLTPAHWLTPEAGPWRGDADYRRLTQWPHAAETLKARYLRRVARGLLAAESMAVWKPDALLPRAGAPTRSAGKPAQAQTSTPTPTPASRDADCLTADQAEAVARLTRLRRRRPLVLVADRGRGKSAALGIAAARRLQQGERQLWVSAPTREAVAPLFARLAALLPEGRVDETGFTLTLAGRPAQVTWLPPERVLPALEGAEIDPHAPPTLLVDEAAAIPAARLICWLERFPRLAFATTVHGYEGTGRGFEVRLRERLDQLTPGWRRLRLSEPVRWAEGDPLEALTRDLLCLDAEAASAETVAARAEHHAVRVVWLDREALAANATLLTQAFGLLVQAHYRTAPSDLRHLLDGPEVMLPAVMLGETLVAIAVVQPEGGFDAALAAEIHHGRRRPRGHLMAQSLAFHGGHLDAACARWWRLMRIAVHPTLRRRGVGSQLLAAVEEAAVAAGIERLGVSFGAEPGLIAFWRHAGFVTLRLGLTREAASGEPALMLGRGLTPVARATLAAMAADFRLLLPDLLSQAARDLDPEVAASLLWEGESGPASNALRARLVWFAEGGGELALVRPWLRQAWLDWWRRQPAPGAELALADTPAESVQGSDVAAALGTPAAIASAVAALFQGHDDRLSDDGRRGRQARARALARGLLAAAGEGRDMVKPAPGE
ncbi:GNAT family N-acetyltransferase [Salinicola sp. DM10]|uniref:GNAT family N-acetyltransferase n=1 Tax=Salinicola sp. DM10 TaxID=2815721 RepID=UPI001A907722|nr:GNAT family N-acetyltransferase [Salinicola sp. DM10]